MLKGAVKSGDASQLTMIADRISERAATATGPDADRMKALSKMLAEDQIAAGL